MRIVILTGAGLSANAGLPTYRGPDGVYTNTDFDVEKFLTFENYKNNPDVVQRYLVELKSKFSSTEPSQWHEWIADLEKEHEVLVVTQNTDGLHQLAGSKNVIELHGSIKGTVVREGIETPNIVFFGDNIDGVKYNHILGWIDEGDVDVSIAVGTTLQFSYLLPIAFAGQRIILVDKDENHPLAQSFDEFYQDINQVTIET